MGCSGCSYKGMSTAVEDTFVGVRFREETNLTLCSTESRIYACGEKVVVDLAGEPTFGKVEQSPMPVFKPCQKAGAKRILRPANDDDVAAHDRKLQRDQSAKLFVHDRAAHRRLLGQALIASVTLGVVLGGVALWAARPILTAIFGDAYAPGTPALLVYWNTWASKL